jgi:Ca-activated chloride channel homolog
VAVTLVTPWLAVVAALAPIAVLALHAHDRAQRRRLTRTIGELAVIGRVIASASPGRRRLKDVLIALAAALIALAAARPQVEGLREVELRGLDLVVAVDASKSMLVDDVGATREMAARAIAPSRLGRARELARAVIDALPGDRIAPIVFAAAAAHFPLTEDHVVAASFLADLGPADLPQGSNLAEVFRVGRCLLRPDQHAELGCAQLSARGHGGDPLRGESLDPPPDPRAADAAGAVAEKTERGKAIVVFTDGGDPDEATALEVRKAREFGIAVFLVGVGSTAGGVVHDIDGEGRPTAAVKRLASGAAVTSRRDDAGLRALAAAAGDAGRYLVAAERGEVDPTPVVEALRAVPRGLATRKIRDHRDVYPPLLFAALMLLVIEAAIGTRRRQRYPEAA